MSFPTTAALPRDPNWTRSKANLQLEKVRERSILGWTKVLTSGGAMRQGQHGEFEYIPKAHRINSLLVLMQLQGNVLVLH